MIDIRRGKVGGKKTPNPRIKKKDFQKYIGHWRKGKN
jgi:hypothetical protein